MAVGARQWRSDPPKSGCKKLVGRVNLAIGKTEGSTTEVSRDFKMDNF